MMLVLRLLVVFAVLGLHSLGAQALPVCNLGYWEVGDQCRRGQLICERKSIHGYGSGLKQWKCWHRRGVKWRPNKNAKMKNFHWF